MFFGMPIETALFVFGMPLLALILGVIYALTFKDFTDNDTWWVFDDLVSPKDKKENSDKEGTVNAE